MQHLEVGDLGLVASLGERLKTVLHELRGATAKHALLAEQVGLGLFGEGGLDDARTGATDRLRVRLRGLPCGTGCVDLDGDDVGNAAACNELAAHGVARSLGSDEDHVDTLRGLDVAETNVEAVRKGEGLACGQVLLDLVVVDRALVLIRCEDHDQISPLSCVCHSEHLEASLFSLSNRLRALLERNDDLNARVAKVHRVCMTLRAVANDGYLLALDDRQVCIGVVVHFSHEWPPY